MNYHYVDNQNQPAGPVNGDALNELIRVGRLPSDPLVVPVGGNEWRPLSDYAEKNAGGPSSASAVILPPPAPATNKVLAASKDAWTAFKMVATNPVGGLPIAFESLGPQRAMGAGIAFGIVFVLAFLINFARLARSLVEPSAIGFGVYATSEGWFWGPTVIGQAQVGFSAYLRCLIVALVPFAALVGTHAVSRKIFKARSGLGQDCFIAGVALLPLVFVLLAAFVLGLNGNNSVFIYTVGTFAACLTILVLFTGLTQISRINVRPATFIVPLDLILAVVACAIVINILPVN